MNTFVFYDDFMLWKYEGIRRRVFRPVHIPEATFWKPSITGGTVLWCPEVNKYRMWYSKIPDITKDWGRFSEFAESEDGLDWHAPGCGEEKSRLAPAVEVMRDEHANNHRERYKCVYIDYKGEYNSKGYIAVSPDGIHWTGDKRYKFCEHASDTKNNLFYNPVTDEYQVILRANHGDRRICCVRSKDLINWTGPELLMSPDPFDEAVTEYYGLVVFPMEGYFLGYLWVYYTDMNDISTYKMAGKVDTFLVYSYDGLHWNRVSKAPLVERATPPEYGSTNIYMHSIVQTTDKGGWILGAGGNRIDHACGFTPVYPDSRIPKLASGGKRYVNLFYKIRREGFVGMESFGYTASMVFKAVDIVGDDLFFNICAPCGWVKFQIIEKIGKTIKGFTFEDSIPFTGDETRYKPVWKEHDLNELKGRRVMIELKMYMAIVFSMSGHIRPHFGLKPQKSLGEVAVI